MENLMLQRSNFGAPSFVDESNTNRHNNRLSASGRAMLQDWRISLAGRNPTTDEKNSIIQRIRLNNKEDSYYCMNNLNGQLRRWASAPGEQNFKAPIGISEKVTGMCDIIFRDISPEERSLYISLVHTYPDNYLDLLETLRKTREENAPEERIKLLCETVRDFYNVDQGITASGSGSSSQIVVSSQIPQIRGRLPGSTVTAARIAEYRSRTNTGRHLPTPSNSSSPEVPLMSLPFDTFSPVTERGSPYASEHGSPLLLNFHSASSAISRDAYNRNNLPSPQTFSIQNTQSSQPGPSGLTHSIIGVKRRCSTSPPPTPLSSQRQHVPLTPSSMRSSESPFRTRSPLLPNSSPETSLKKEVGHYCMTNVPPGSSLSANTSFNKPLPVNNQTNNITVLFSSEEVEKKVAVCSTAAIGTLERPFAGSAMYANDESVTDQPLLPQSMIMGSSTKTVEEFEEWFENHATELLQQLGGKEIVPKTEEQFEEFFADSEIQLREWMETLKKERACIEIA